MECEIIGGNNKLDLILADKAKELAELKTQVSLTEIKEKAENFQRTVRNFNQALTDPAQVSLIAEIKKASPSLGDINTEVDILEQAKTYERAGANAISVLTDAHFKGEIGFLKQIKEVTNIPILRKDFIFDEYQIYESYLAGADALLLIATVLNQDSLNSLVELTHRLGMECLVEAHTQEDLNRALATNAQAIGINARNLKTFEVSLDNILNIADKIPKNHLFIAESGIETGEDVSRLAQAGAKAILVGTTLMKAQDVSAKIRELCIKL